MKRFLFFWLFLLCVAGNAQAQAPTDDMKYELQWVLGLYGSGQKTGCDCYFTIYAEMESGPDQYIGREFVTNLDPGKYVQFDGKYLYSLKNKVKRIKFFTIKANTNCSVAGQGTYTTETFAFSTSNCARYYYKNDPHNFAPGYGSESFLDINLRPTGGKSVITINVSNKLTASAWEFHSTATINYVNSISKDVMYLKLDASDLPYENKMATVQRQTYSGDIVKDIDINYAWRPGPYDAFRYGSKKITVNATTQEFNITVPTPYNDMSAPDATISIKEEKSYYYLKSGPEVNNTILPTDDKITMTPVYSPLIAGDFLWSYRSPDGRSPVFPSQYYKINPVVFSARDLFGNNVDDYVGQEISVYSIIGCGSLAAASSADYKLIIAQSAPEIVEATGIDFTCPGGSDGRVRVKFNRQLLAGETLDLQVVDPNAGPGGTVRNIPVTIAADGTFTSPLSIPIPGGTYDITLIGSYKGKPTYTAGDKRKTRITINEPKPLVFSTPVPGAVNCYDGSDGSITLSATGGTPVYKMLYKAAGDPTYNSVNFTANPFKLTGLPKGDYTISATDNYNCPAKSATGATEMTVTVTQPDAPLQTDNVTIVSPLANGSSDGSLTVRLKGGTPLADGSYTVTWTKNGQPVIPANTVGTGIYSTVLNNITAGTYILTVRDKNYAAAATGNNGGCTFTASYTVNEPPVLKADIQVSDSISCYGMADGSLTAIPSGGVPRSVAPYYQFRWYKEVNSTWQDLGITTAKATGLNAGRYRVSVTDANNITRYSDPKDFTEPGDLKIQFTEVPVSCFGGSNGTSTAIVTGGTSPFKYAWNTGSTLPSATALATGTYTLAITDYHGCSTSDISFIGQPAEALQIVSAPITYPRGYGYTDGSIRVLLKGGTKKADGSYNITWKRADGTVLSSYTSSVQTGGYETILNSIGAGDYVLIVTDANYTGTGLASDQQACQIEQPFHVTQPDPIITAVSETHYVSCKGDADGILEVTTTGGIQFAGAQPYHYEWYRIIGGVSTLLPYTTNTAAGLIAGNYIVIVTDLNSVSKVSDTFRLVEPDLLQMDLTVRAVSCNSGTDGFVKSKVTGGSLPYTWSWTNGADSQDIINVSAGHYELLLTDAHACIVRKDTTVIEPQLPLAISDVITVDPKAFTYTDGSVQVTLTGGTPTTAGLYSIEWTDASGRQLTSFTQTKTANGVVTVLQNVGDGDYTLKVKDAQFDNSTDGSTAGCYVAGTYTLTEPPLLEAAIREYRYISCLNVSDGQLAAHAQGGIPLATGLPYKYQWYSVVNGTERLIPQTDSIIRGMPAGDYIVKVTDYNNITRTSPVFTLQQPAALNIQFTTSAVTCASGMDGSITSNVSGGTMPYKYEWTNGETTATINDLTEGSYILYVTDAHGCVTLKQEDVFIPDGIKTTPVVKAPTCTDDCDGAITVAVSGGVAPYTYEWENGSRDKDRANLCAGKYTLTITDANNCKRIQSFTLTNPAPLTINVGTDKTICNGQTWTVSAAIADAGASYLWTGDNGFSSDKSAVTFNTAGKYNVQVTDSKGCQGADTIIIKVNQADIAAEFVAPTQAFAGETVSFVNISSPAPEWVEWILPEQGVKVAGKTDWLTELQFEDTGLYTISLRAHVGDCETTFTKSISILKGQDFPVPGGAQNPFILDFTVTPNPNEGQFNAHVKLDKQSEIRLRMINIISNQLVSDRKESAATEFNVGYQLNIPSGTYLLLLETPMGNAVRKIVLNK